VQATRLSTIQQDKHYSAEALNDQFMAFVSLGVSTASTIVKKANLLLVLETETILNYKMQNGIIEYTREFKKIKNETAS
jgi:hypothetical protein